MSDLISRQAVLSLAKDVILEGGIKHRCIDATMIHELPSVQPERKKGKWIRWYEKIENDTCTEYIPHCKCSECGTDINARSSLFIKFCPYCGAEIYDYTAMTNGDRIRAMTDEELANLINRIEPKLCHDGLDYMIGCDEDKDCAMCWIDWLKQEVDCGD